MERERGGIEGGIEGCRELKTQTAFPCKKSRQDLMHRHIHI
jgi:hypothetical protein